MVMTHYMELLSLHEPWFLILFMLVPMVLAETILAAGAFSLLYKDSRSEKWDSLSHVCGLILGVFFIVATVYIVTSYVPTIQWRGPIDYISIWSWASSRPSSSSCRNWASSLRASIQRQKSRNTSSS